MLSGCIYRDGDDPFDSGAQRCACAGYEAISELPREGERLEFGRHRIPPEDAETAPAWPSLGKFAAAMRRRSLGR